MVSNVFFWNVNEIVFVDAKTGEVEKLMRVVDDVTDLLELLDYEGIEEIGSFDPEGDLKKLEAMAAEFREGMKANVSVMEVRDKNDRRICLRRCEFVWMLELEGLGMYMLRR